jgi:hypothetical protein
MNWQNVDRGLSDDLRESVGRNRSTAPNPFSSTEAASLQSHDRIGANIRQENAHVPRCRGRGWPNGQSIF